MNDPYEDTNLYHSQKPEHMNAKTELYDLIPTYMSKARLRPTFISSRPDCYASWRFADFTIVPWVNVENNKLHYCDSMSNDDDLYSQSFPTISPSKGFPTLHPFGSPPKDTFPGGGDPPPDPPGLPKK